MLPLISIIIPTFNSGMTIANCLNSIVRQSYSHIEILIVDGLSSDNTIEIVRGYKKTFSYIKFLSESDKGIYDAINKGIKLAKGEFLYFLGSDDELYDDEVLGKIFLDSGLGSNYDVIYGNVLSKAMGGIYAGNFNNDKLLLQNICHQSIFFRRSVFDDIGLYNTKYRSHADWEHNFRWFFSKNIRHIFLDLTIANYADNGFSAKNPDNIFDREKWLQYLLSAKKSISFSKKIQLMRKYAGYAYFKKDLNIFLRLTRMSFKILFT